MNRKLYHKGLPRCLGLHWHQREKLKKTCRLLLELLWHRFKHLYKNITPLYFLRKLQKLIISNHCQDAKFSHFSMRYSDFQALGKYGCAAKEVPVCQRSSPVLGYHNIREKTL